MKFQSNIIGQQKRCVLKNECFCFIPIRFESHWLYSTLAIRIQFYRKKIDFKINANQIDVGTLLRLNHNSKKANSIDKKYIEISIIDEYCVYSN